MKSFAFQIETINGGEPSKKLEELGYSYDVWRPSLTNIIPKPFPKKYLLYWVFHFFGIFKNKDYAAVRVFDKKVIAFYMMVAPKYFKWQFMGKNDVQFIYGFTSKKHRRLGIAKLAMEGAIKEFQKPKRKIWGVIKRDNAPSINWVQKLGFVRAGEIERKYFLGLKPLRVLSIKK